MSASDVDVPQCSCDGGPNGEHRDWCETWHPNHPCHGEVCSLARNIFEWCWEHSADLLDEDRVALLHHAFHATSFWDRTEANAIRLANTDPWVNGRLISGGWLAIDERVHAMWFPRYEAWRAGSEVTAR